MYLTFKSHFGSIHKRVAYQVFIRKKGPLLLCFALQRGRHWVGFPFLSTLMYNIVHSCIYVNMLKARPPPKKKTLNGQQKCNGNGQKLTPLACKVCVIALQTMSPCGHTPPPFLTPLPGEFEPFPQHKGGLQFHRPIRLDLFDKVKCIY